MVAEPAAAVVTVAMSALGEGAEPELAFAAVTVATSARAAVAALAPEVAVAAAPVVKCPPCSRLSVVRLDQCFAVVLPSLDNSR